MTLEPIVHELSLPVEPERAFAAFVAIGRWWDPRYTRDAETLVDVVIEPRVGGRILALHRDGEDEWGRVAAYDPPHELAVTWTLAQRGAPASAVSVRFSPAPAGTTVRFEHGGWTAANAHARTTFSEWHQLLDRYVATLG
jgi:uncharacterized protein YndB with AHSA1/START domain